MKNRKRRLFVDRLKTGADLAFNSLQLKVDECNIDDTLEYKLSIGEYKVDAFLESNNNNSVSFCLAKETETDYLKSPILTIKGNRVLKGHHLMQDIVDSTLKCMGIINIIEASNALNQDSRTSSETT